MGGNKNILPSGEWGDLGQEAETLKEGKGGPSVVSFKDACQQQVLSKC